MNKWQWVQSGWTSYSSNVFSNYALGNYARGVVSQIG
jgi:hypothetical protein